MGEFLLGGVDLGAVNANKGGSIDALKLAANQAPGDAVIKEVRIDNSSRAILKLQNLPGSPVINPGDRPTVHVGTRFLVVVPDVDVVAGEVMLYPTVSWRD